MSFDDPLKHTPYCELDRDNKIVKLPRDQSGQPLRCPGVGRDKDNSRALQFYFNRPVTDAEMRFLHEVMQRSVALMPRTTQ